MKRIVFILILTLYSAAVAYPVEGVTLSYDEAYLYDQINEVRVNSGLSSLLINDLLIEVAREHSIEMLTSGYFDHLSPVDGSTPYSRVERSGYYDGYYGVKVVSENIGLTWNGVNVDVVIEAWMESQGHAENILSSYVNEVGVGIAVGEYMGKGEAALYTVVFAYRDGASETITVTTSLTQTQTQTSRPLNSTSLSSSTIDRAHTTNSTTMNLDSKTISTDINSPTTQFLSTTRTSSHIMITTITATSTIEDSSITHQGRGLKINIVSNSTISNMLYDINRGLINFTVTGLEETKGFFNASIPKSLLDGTPIVLVDEKRIEVDLREDIDNYYVYFIYSHSSHNIVIGGSNTIPELLHTPIIILLVAAIISQLMNTSTKRTGKGNSS